MTIDRSFASFAHPSIEPWRRRPLRDDLIAGAAKRAASIFVGQWAGALEAASAGLVQVLRDWRDADITFAEALQVPFALRGIRTTPLDPRWTAAQVAAHLHANGREGSWRLALAPAAPLAFGWRFMRPAATVAVDATADRVQVALDDDAPCELSASGHDVPVVDFAGAPVRIVDRDVQQRYPFNSLVDLADVPTSEIAGTLRDTAELLRRHAPEYLAWVQDALGAVVPLRRPEDAYQSFSLMGVNAVIFVCFPIPPLKLAELLVHEASHQYYHFAQFRTSFSNGTDQRRYYSPFVRKERPIERLLIAFHAFANIVRFYRACLDSGLGDSRALAEAEIEDNLRQLTPLVRDLDATSDLTPAARGLYEPLREELSASVISS